MKHFKLATALVMAALTITSCKKSSDDTSGTCTNTTNWLKDGHELVYVNTPIYIDADTLYVTFNQVGDDIFKNTSEFDDGSVYPTEIVYTQPCGNSVYQSDTSTMANKQQAYLLSGNVGESWTTTSQSLGGLTINTTTTIVSTNVSVSVPMGTYTCIDLHSVSVPSNVPSDSTVTDTYINSQYGPVKISGLTLEYDLARVNF